jgi:hypothetical protein
MPVATTTKACGDRYPARHELDPTVKAADPARAKQFLTRSPMLGTLRRDAAMTLDEAVR